MGKKMTDREMMKMSLELITDSVDNFKEVALWEMASMGLSYDHRNVVLDKIRVMKGLTELMNKNDAVRDSQLGFLLHGVVSLMLDAPTLADDLLKKFSDEVIGHMERLNLERMKGKI